ncbi:hypothetical protein [Bacillus sp. UNC438CL73TsuS30]|uniref:hypothetical protein n=1 Tax=Bacillus sp. UNC438CL73TsuS30 TaxID=1340434 RepID=UPI000AA330F5|nr:hypothetical protein [Bacillus sp. UNC438CL73TsuS30]
MKENLEQKIKDNLKRNPFYKESNKDLLKVKIDGHLKSETPFISIKNIAIEID